MTDKMNQQQAGEKAASYFGEGYHCAEAVVAERVNENETPLCVN